MFALFIVVGVFMVLNILIAVISDAYIDTKERLLCEPETMDFAAEGQHLLEEVRRDTDRDRQRQTETESAYICSTAVAVTVVDWF